MPDILIAPNSFKECADSAEIAGLFAKYLPAAFAPAFRADTSEPNLIIKPLSDGGDGFLNAVGSIYPARILEYSLSSPCADDSVFLCKIGYYEERREVYIESAEILGLKKIPRDKRKPLKLNSKGLGDILSRLAKNKADRILDVDKVIIGIGGTGTVDFGMGACAVFGMKLYDGSHTVIEPVPQNFALIKYIEFHKPRLPFDVEAVIDVDNPLTGEKGAAKVFAMQKGASADEVEILENGIQNIVYLLREKDKGFDKIFLSGAGGGLGGALHYFFDAKYKGSDEFILDTIGIRNIDADIVITGEGSFDRQSMMNKASGIIINESAPKGIPVFVICGRADLNGISDIPENVKFIELNKYFGSQEESIERYEDGIKKACDEIVEIYKRIKK